MRYPFEFTIPAGTQASDPHQESIKLNVGTLVNVSVFFPRGCHHLVHFRLFDGAFCLVPADVDLSIHGDGEWILIPMDYVIPSKPYELILDGTSPGCEFNHTLSVYLDVREDKPTTRRDLAAMLAELQEGIEA